MNKIKKYPASEANRINAMLDIAFPDEHQRFPVDIRKIAKEIPEVKNSKDPIKKIQGVDAATFEGALVPNKKGWAIFYGTHRSKFRQNFTIAHELGHYILHRNFVEEIKKDGIECMKEDIGSNIGNKEIEQEANEFASNILMPLNDFRKQIGAKELISREKIEECSNRYKTSIEATLLQWIKYTETKSIIISSMNGQVKWARASQRAFENRLYIKTIGVDPVKIPQKTQEMIEKSPNSKKCIVHEESGYFKEMHTETIMQSYRGEKITSVITFADSIEKDEEEYIEDLRDIIRNNHNI